MSAQDEHEVNNSRVTENGEVHEDPGVAGRIARAFIDSPLSPLLYFAMLFMGLLGLAVTPRQEDPQISVPMVDIMVRYEGASAEQVASLAIDPLERIMSEMPGVKHVYSASMRSQGIVTVEFEVGEEMESSLVKLYDKLQSNMDKIPPGVSQPLVKPKGIDDVPVVTLTLWSEDVDDGALRTLALDVLQNLKEIPDTGPGYVIGGRREQVRVEVYPERLSGYGITLGSVARTIQTANSERPVGDSEAAGTHLVVDSGSFLRRAEDIKRLVVGMHQGVPVYVRDVARVEQGPEDAKQLVSYYTGPAYQQAYGEELRAEGLPAVTIAVAKKVNTNGVDVANAIMSKTEELKGQLIPGNVHVAVTRNYGVTANDKVNELIGKLFKATGFVFLLVLGFFLAFRPALVVLLIVPVVILFTVFCAFLMGYTIDRVSLFALIFSIGILVDDAIVVVENIYRRWLMKGETDTETAVDAVREVGNPTILATFTVIAALLPMGFVSGMMGPYMEPIPALGSVAMLISLQAAFMFTPWLSMRLKPTMAYLRKAEKREHRQGEWWEKLYRAILTPMIDHRGKRLLFRLVLWGTFFFACAMFYFKWVAVKMLPLDNKPEFSVVINMPEGTALPVTANLAHQMAQLLRSVPEVTALQTYSGTARPFDFNGMVRHYYLRQEPWQGEIQVQLLHKSLRERSSHEIAVEARNMLTPVAHAQGARIEVVEMPPGPPVLQSVVAEVHGPDDGTRRQVASDLTGFFEEAESIVDVDNYMTEPYFYWRFEVDTEKAVRRGVSVDAVNQALAMAMGGEVLGDVKQRTVLEPTSIVIQVPLAVRSQVSRLSDLPVQTASGQLLPLSELGRFVKVMHDPIVYHKDLRSIEYVTGDVAGRLAAPVYGMFQVLDLLEKNGYRAPDGVQVQSYWFGPPPDDKVSAFEWTGEWTVTFETFRDMGLAFMAALVLIYILVVWEFGNFRIPALIMAPIPLTLLGIIPAHALTGKEFTATSMIGWIALAGIIVRNSILLVDFSIHEVRKGTPVRDAVILSCKTRTRPILITALALVAGSSVIFTDPIFNGMAISLAAGVMVSTVLTLIVIPLGCISAQKSLHEVAGVPMPIEETPPPPVVSRPAVAAGAGGRSWGIALWSAFIGVVFFVIRIISGLLRLLLAWIPRPSLPKRRPGSGGGPAGGKVRAPRGGPATGGSGEGGGPIGAPKATSGGGGAPLPAGGLSSGAEVVPARTGAAEPAGAFASPQAPVEEGKRSTVLIASEPGREEGERARVKIAVRPPASPAPAEEPAVHPGGEEARIPVAEAAASKVAKKAERSPKEKLTPDAAPAVPRSSSERAKSERTGPTTANVVSRRNGATKGRRRSSRRGIRLKAGVDD
jgi:multidrug efflux pump subunit AcrB